MHSSRMRTARLLPVSPSMHCSRGVPGLGGCTWSRRVYLPGPGGCTCLVPGRVYLPGPAGACTCLVLGGVPARSQGGCTCLVWGAYLSGLGVYLPGLRGVPGPGRCTCLVLGGVPDWSYLPGPGGVPPWPRGDIPGPGGVPAWSRGYLPGPGGGCTCLVPGEVYLPPRGQNS